jgi:hypothetical protein
MHFSLIISSLALVLTPFIRYDGVRVCLRTAFTNGPILHRSGDMQPSRAWLVHQSSLAVLPAETSGTSRRNGRRRENFAYQCLKYLTGSLTCRKILRNGTSGFTFHAMEGVLRIFIALKNPSPRPGLNTPPLGPVASTLTTTPLRRLQSSCTSKRCEGIGTRIALFLVLCIN